jgi:hypothetical protein
MRATQYPAKSTALPRFSFKIWAWIAAMIGPLALSLVFFFPDLHGKNGDHA